MSYFPANTVDLVLDIAHAFDPHYRVMPFHVAEVLLVSNPVLGHEFGIPLKTLIANDHIGFVIRELLAFRDAKPATPAYADHPDALSPSQGEVTFEIGIVEIPPPEVALSVFPRRAMRASPQREIDAPRQ